MESYNNQTPASPEYTSRFSLWIPLHNIVRRGQQTNVAEKLNYWGSDLWYWQHWIRKGVVYVLAGYSFYFFRV